MPLYRKPHDYQIVYKIDVDPQSLALLQSEHLGLISMLPGNFDLDRLINGEQLDINANIYQGHFERGGKLWLKDIRLTFMQPVFVRGLQASQLKDAASEVVYEQVQLANQRVLLVRHITQAPSVDHLMVLTQKTADDSNVQCEFPQKELMEKSYRLNLDIEPSIKREQGAIQNLLSGCFDVIDSYWETADFRN